MGAKENGKWRAGAKEEHAEQRVLTGIKSGDQAQRRKVGTELEGGDHRQRRRVGSRDWVQRRKSEN